MAKSFKKLIKPTFNATVEIPVPGADAISGTFKFKSMSRPELARLFDSWKEKGIALITEAQAAEKEGNEYSLEKWGEKEALMQRDQIKDIAEGWGFDEEFNDENILDLVNISTHVASAITEAYTEAYARAREGN